MPTPAALSSLREDERTTIDTGRSYAQGRPVRVRVHKRGRWYHLDDAEGAAALAGWAPHAAEAADRVVAEAGLNVTRTGRVFVSAVEGRDLSALIEKVAETSLALRDALLELDDPVGPPLTSG